MNLSVFGMFQSVMVMVAETVCPSLATSGWFLSLSDNMCARNAHGKWVPYGASPVAHDKEFACSGENAGLIPGPGRSPGEGNGSPLQSSCLRNLTDRGAWQATAHGVARSWTQLSDQTTR